MKELENVKYQIEENFSDPLNENYLKDFILGESKKIRSKLAILYLKAYGCEITDSVYKVLAAGELIHNASLLHDDVLDNADKRRGKTTISKQFSEKISILAGDYLISFAIEKLLQINNEKILDIFKECTKKMSEAEIKQYFLRNSIPLLEEYIDICKGKTSGLFASVIQSCAILCNLQVEKAGQFGEKYGILFQIKNDLNEESAKADKENGIFTVKDILGIEKTAALLDNYQEEMRHLLEEIPDNKYRQELEDLCLTKKQLKLI